MYKTMQLKHPNGFVVGTCHESAYGWHFIPGVTGHRGTRKHGIQTADACIPGWARKWLAKGCSLVEVLPDPEKAQKRIDTCWERVEDAIKNLRLHQDSLAAHDLADAARALSGAFADAGEEPRR